MTNMTSQSWKSKQFDVIGNDPLSWMTSADELLAVARTLKHQREATNLDKLKIGDLFPDEARGGAIERMLQGFAVECLLKGMWVKKGNKIVSGGKQINIPGVKGQHDLQKLAKAVGFTITEEQKDILKRLTFFIKLAGSYPIPTREGDGSGVSWKSPVDDQTLKKLVKEMLGKLTA
jgi:hypothetical protein